MELTAQVAEGYAQEMHRILILSCTPKFMNQLVMSQDPVGVVNQYFEEVVLGRRKLYLGVADKYLPLAKSTLRSPDTKISP